jgi:hypothetical protein
MESIRKHWFSNRKAEYRFCIYFIESCTGYFDLCFHFDNLKIQMFYSTCINSVDNISKWIEKIDKNEEYIEFTIDEEGPLNKIVLKNMNKEDIYELNIIHDFYEFKKFVSIKSFLEKLLYAFYRLTNENIWGINNSYGQIVKDNLNKYFIKYKIYENKECITCREILCKE